MTENQLTERQTYRVLSKTPGITGVREVLRGKYGERNVEYIHHSWHPCYGLRFERQHLSGSLCNHSKKSECEDSENSIVKCMEVVSSYHVSGTCSRRLCIFVGLLCAPRGDLEKARHTLNHAAYVSPLERTERRE